MISGILNGIAAGSADVNLGNNTLNFIAGLPQLILGAAAGVFGS